MDLIKSEQSVGTFFYLLLLLTFVIWIAKQSGFFRLPPPTRVPPVTWIHLAGGVLTYLIAASVIVPLLISLVAYLITGSLISIKDLSSLWKSWGQLGGLCVLLLALILYCFWISPQARHFVFWGEKQASWIRFIKSSGMGFVGWIVSYPFVLVSTVIAAALAKWFWGESQLEQVAVKQLKMTMGNTPLFLTMILVVSLFVPFMEELLFRGLLQNVLKRYLKRSWAIALTALIFSCFHYSPSQGTGNFQLILSLLVLSGFLGFIYERERTLWAPIFLHATFNSLNVLAITFAQ